LILLVSAYLRISGQDCLGRAGRPLVLTPSRRPISGAFVPLIAIRA
jgi:hypothetical protein